MREGRCTGGSYLDHTEWRNKKTERTEYVKTEVKRKPKNRKKKIRYIRAFTPDISM